MSSCPRQPTQTTINQGRRDGYTMARDGTALRRWTAQRLHAGEGRHGATAMDGTTERRLHDGEGRRGATAMGCRDSSSKAREGASAARDGATHDGEGQRGVCAPGK